MKALRLLAFALTLITCRLHSISATNDDELPWCCLCPGCGLAVPGRGSMNVNQHGLTCDDLAVEMADPQNESTKGSKVCRELQEQFRQPCCDPLFDPDHNIPQAPTSAPAAPNFPEGDEPWCDICTDGSFPTIPHTITAILYMKGNPTCGDLFWLGRSGRIPDRICAPLVDWAVDPCGCPKDKVPAPTPSPLQKTPKPTASMGCQNCVWVAKKVVGATNMKKCLKKCTKKTASFPRIKGDCPGLCNAGLASTETKKKLRAKIACKATGYC